MSDEKLTPFDLSRGDADALDPLLARAIDGLPREIAPARDLWPGIAVRLERSERPAKSLRPGRRPAFARRPAALALAASILLALAAAFWLAGSGDRVQEPLVATASPLEGSAVVPATVQRTVYSESEATLAGIRDQLQREIEAQQGRLPAETRALVFENLKTIDRALAEIEKALASTPGNMELARTAIVYRQRQIELLRHANRVAARL